MTKIADKVELPKILLVDDDERVGNSLKALLVFDQFRVSIAANVGEALYLIDTESFDVLVIDLHMHGAADGFIVLSAMRHSHPDAIMLMFTGYPASKESSNAILSQAYEVLPKPRLCSHR
jgi:DNA-binding NtrC family response regulator